MKHSVLIILLVFMVGFTFAQSNWSPVKSPQEATMYNRHHSFFLNPNEGWLVGTSSGVSVVFHTLDGGSTWTVQYNDSAGFTMYDVAFANSNVGWICGGSGSIWKSTDGGASWSDQTPGLTSQTLRCISIVDANVVYIGGGDGTVLKTTDGGANWVDQTIAAMGTSDLYDIYAWDAFKAFGVSGGNDGTAVYTNDGGATWNLTVLPFPPTGISQRSYDCTGKAGGVGYAVGYHGNVFKSTDFGQTWTNVANIFPGLYKIFYSVGVYNDNVWAGGSDGKLFRSTDGGAVWDTLSLPSVNNIYSIYPFDANNLYVTSNYGQFFKSSDGGNTWTPMLTWPNVSWYAMVAPSVNKIVAASITGGEISISNDGGQTWSYPLKPTPDAIGNILKLFFLDDNRGFYSGRSGQIGKTIDGGLTWALKPNSKFYFGSTKSYYFIYFLDAAKGYAGGSSGIIQATTDGGETWTEGSVGTTATLYDCQFFDSNTGIISASSGRIYQTTDGGSNWTEVHDFGTMTMRDIAIINSTTAVISASSGYVFKTTDAGANWTQVVQLANVNSPGDDPDLYRVDFVDANTGYICGEDGAIYKSTDAGDNWTQQVSPAGLENWNYEAMAWPSKNVGFIGSQNGYIFANGLTGIENKPQTLRGYHLNQNYPNPFNPETNIGFNIPKSEKVTLVIYNTLGQVVRTANLGTLEAGYHQVKWNGRNDFGFQSPSGVYFYRLVAGDFSQIHKMVLMR